MEFYHRPVLLEEVLQGLALRAGGIYFDGTVGGAGHSYEILRRCPSATLIACDRDEEAIAAATERLAPFEGRVRLYLDNYKNFADILDRAGVDELDGALLDFGISSHQIDDPKRGFSYRTADAPLDMRMGRDTALTAAQVVNEYSESELSGLFRRYGEEPFAAAVARSVVRARTRAPIRTAGELKALVEESIPPKFRSATCAKRVFQAIRIEVNGELDGLGECVRGLARRLKPGGRICVITFHSLEDRIVKETFKELASDCVCPKNFPVCTCGKKKEIEILTKKPITAGDGELRDNPRSASAKLRIAEKVRTQNQKEYDPGGIMKGSRE